jgi:8-oxo-dGTP pyrophosphatase MutT (NUDIX family)
MIECAIRESKEELNIDILEKDCEVVHISHRVSPQNR